VGLVGLIFLGGSRPEKVVKTRRHTENPNQADLAKDETKSEKHQNAEDTQADGNIDAGHNAKLARFSSMLGSSGVRHLSLGRRCRYNI